MASPRHNQTLERTVPAGMIVPGQEPVRAGPAAQRQLVMRRLITESWRYARIVAILVGVGFGISAFLWGPVALVLMLWFGGSAVSALRLEGRTDAVVAHGQWTAVSTPIFYAILGVEVLAIASVLTLFASILVMWLAGGRDDA